MTGTPNSTNPNEHFHHGPQPNELGKALNKGLTKAEPYSKTILIVVVAAVIAAGAYVFWQRSAAAQKQVGWDEFALSRAPDDYLALADKYPDRPVGQWARLHAGRQFLEEGLRQSLTNRSASDERLKQAKAAYEQLLKKNDNPRLREEALYGLATSLEALSDGNSKDALQAYEQLLQDYPESQHRKWAKERVAALKTKNAESFYAWFRKQNPKPADRPSPMDIPSNPPDEVFKDLLQLPQETSGTSGTGTGAADEMKIELPKVEGESPKEFPENAEKPAAPEMKAPDVPQAPATPAADAPAATPPAPGDAPAAEPKPAPAESPAPETPAPPAETPPPPAESSEPAPAAESN